MIKEPLYSINNFKWKANRQLASQEGYQRYDVDVKNKKLIPFKNTKLDIKRKFIEPILEKNVKNKTVLDLGCDKGYFSWYAMESGATEIVANDIDKNVCEYINFLCKTMRWSFIKSLNKNLFLEKKIKKNYVICLAMIHEVNNLSHESIIECIRDMCTEGAMIEFCEDYQYKFGNNWNKIWFEKIIEKLFKKYELIGVYDAVAKKTGQRYLYDCKC
jgi:2-polyprenyl-3-methyl-5-hydroxy-6-metoxy-1,4-benzoquinol methylase